MTLSAYQRRGAGAAAGLLVAAGLLGACQSSPQPATSAATEPSTTDSPATAGMRVYLDPETGQLGPFPAGVEVPVDSEMSAQAAMGEPVETVLPDGSVMMELNGHGQHYYVVDVDPSGRRSVRCVQDSAAAPQAPAGSSTPEVQ